MLVELLDLIETVIATRNPNHAPIKCANQMESNCTITGITKLEQSTTKKAYQTQPKRGKVPAKKATATSVEKLDEAMKQGKWFGDTHINEAMKMIQSQFHLWQDFTTCY